MRFSLGSGVIRVAMTRQVDWVRVRDDSGLVSEEDPLLELVSEEDPLPPVYITLISWPYIIIY